MSEAQWTDLLDPGEAEVRRAWSYDVHPSALQTLVAPREHADEPRPRFESHGTYVFGVLLIPVAVEEENRIFYQEVDLLLSEQHVLTVRKTPGDGPPFDVSGVEEICRIGKPAGKVAYHVVDDVAEAFLDLVDALHDEIDELEDHVDEWSSEEVRRRLSDLRHDLLHIRRTLAPTRDAVRKIVDDRVDLDEGTLFPREVEIAFGDAYDKLLRSTEGLEFARDLIAGVRDYHQAKVANDQNEVMKRLTAVASLLLVPTFIVGVYGQNFDVLPELQWAQGYGFSWSMIVVSTVVQLWYFRHRKWI